MRWKIATVVLGVLLASVLMVAISAPVASGTKTAEQLYQADVNLAVPGLVWHKAPDGYAAEKNGMTYMVNPFGVSMEILSIAKLSREQLTRDTKIIAVVDLVVTRSYKVLSNVAKDIGAFIKSSMKSGTKSGHVGPVSNWWAYSVIFSMKVDTLEVLLIHFGY